ncbi:MAG: transporter substrate-binding domain-containing protein [Leptolyngbyaceae cyanobacterium bins.349]|nr:transporter substrate-binding domain-containing protein [Leptolyngbyaceae cyanobacterium bins.349]
MTRSLGWLPIGLGLIIGTTIPGYLAISPSSVDAADLQTIKRRGRLVVAVKDNLPPLGFRDPAGRLQGFEIDLARQIAMELLGNPDALELKPALNQDRLNAVLAGDVDVAIAHVTLTPSRLRIVNFSSPYYRDGAAIATPYASLQSLADLAGKPIAVLDRSSTVEALRRALPSAILIPVQSYEDAKIAVETGRAIAVAADASILVGWVRQLPTYRLLTPLLSRQELAIVLPKGRQHEELRQEINQILTRLLTSGWLQQRANYWGLPRNLSF